MKPFTTACLTAAMFLPTHTPDAMATTPATDEKQYWSATWLASAQPVWDSGFLFPTNVPSILQNQTVRQVARISLGGNRLRIVLSNAFGKQPVTLGKMTIGRPGKGGGSEVENIRTVTYGGQTEATILPGASLLSDAVTLPVSSLSKVVISFYLPNETPLSTFHWDGRQTGWIAPGDQTLMSALSNQGGKLLTTTARPLLTGIQVETSHLPQTVVVMGDSITDGAMASLDKDRRWTDFLAARFAPYHVAVVNAGISGARLLSDGMGKHALARLDRDVFSQPGVRSVIILLGINDISWPGTAFAPQSPRPTLSELKAGYSQIVAQLHSRGIRVTGTTLTPFEGALPDTPLENYYHPDKDKLREQVNDWILHSGVFDAVIDFDAVLRDPAHPSRLLGRYDSADHLHPGDDGNRAMADAVDLKAILPGTAAEPQNAGQCQF